MCDSSCMSAGLRSDWQSASFTSLLYDADLLCVIYDKIHLAALNALKRSAQALAHIAAVQQFQKISSMNDICNWMLLQTTKATK